MRAALLTSLPCWTLGVVALLSPAGSQWVRAQQAEAEAEAAFFQEQVRPVLETRCFGCHGPQPTVQAGLRLNSRAAILQGGRRGPAVDLEDPESSLLIRAINYAGPEMPPGGPLPPEQVALLTRWVTQGLPWPEEQRQEPVTAVREESDGSPGVEESRHFWSFQPPRRPQVPRVERQDWVRTPIDAFVLARLEAARLEPSPPAGKGALLRRAYYDLTGLPPSPAEVEAFLADASPGAFARVVDRLLASPQYGERWARHWLDLVRYAESNSYERDGPKPLVWRYRDYVIRSFSQGKPYDRFVLEQLAGDELEPAAPENVIATGFYRLGLWQDEPVDPVQELYEDLDDIVTTTSQVFLGLTLNCARCHDHKLDPLPQRDYYRFLAFFHGMKRYGVRKPETVAEASLCDIGPPRESRRRLEANWRGRRYERRSASVLSYLEKIEKLVADDLTAEEKEAFRQEANRAGILAKRVPRLVSETQLEGYADIQETPGVDTGGRNQPESAGALRDRNGSAAPGNLRAGPRQRSGQGGAGRAGLPLGPFASPPAAWPAGGKGEDLWAAAGPGPLDRQSRQSAHGAGHDQPGLAIPFRAGPGGDAQRLRLSGRTPHPSWAAGLAGGGMGPGRLASEADPPDDPVVQRLSDVLGASGGRPGARS